MIHGSLSLVVPCDGDHQRFSIYCQRTLIDLPITMLGSTHDMKLVQELFPRMIVMDGGRVVADGLTIKILTDKKLLNVHGLEKS